MTLIDLPDIQNYTDLSPFSGGKDEDDKPGPSSTPHPEKTPAKETDFYDLPDGLSDNEEQNQGQVQRSG